jgi:hypothetical protein
MGPVGPFSERARENMKDTVARLAPKYSSTGRINTGKPLFTAVLFMELTKAPSVTIHQPKNILGRWRSEIGRFKGYSRSGELAQTAAIL